MTIRQRLVTPLALAVLALLAAWPLIRSGPPLLLNTITDGPNHLHRFVLLSWHVQHGDWYPRWFSDLHFGFGAPVLNFYAPLSYYILLLLHVFVPSEPVTFLLGFVLAITVQVVGLYVWVREQFQSPLAGIVTAAAGVFVPYLYYSAMDRAAYPEVWGLALAPWLFWAAVRLIRQTSGGRWATLSVLYAIFILTHNLSALLFTPVLIVYCGLVWLESKQALTVTNAKPLFAVAAALVLAVGLGAFFLVPFAWESGNIQLDRTVAYNVRFSFEPLQELFSGPVTFDPRYILDRKPLSVPWPQLALAGLAVGAVLGRPKGRPARLTVLVSAGLLAGLLFLTQAVSQPVWDLLPFTNVIQFTFRLFAPAMLLLAWLAGAALVGLPDRWQKWLALGAVAVMGVYILSWTYHKPYDSFPDTIRPIDIIQDEQTHPYRVGTTNLMEFLPRWVKSLPATDTLSPRYADAEIPSRLGDLPPGVSVQTDQTTLKTEDLTYTAAQAATLTFDIFYFPGWSATVDGEAVDIGISDPNGLIQVQVPAGEHHLKVALRPTPAQVIGAIISLVALLLLAWPLVVGWRAGSKKQAAILVPRPGLSAWFIVLGLGLLAFRVGLADRLLTPFYRVQLDRISHPLAINFGDQLTLLGFDFPQGTSAVAGEPVNLNLYWQIRQPLTTDYQVGVQLVDDLGNHFGQSDHQNIDGVPTSQWTLEDYGRDEHQVLSLSGTPPGTYHLLVKVYSFQNGVSQALPYTTETGTAIDYDLGTATVTRAAAQPAGPLHVLEANLAATQASVGDPVSFTLLFNSGEQPKAGTVARLALTSADGQAIYSKDVQPAGPNYPADQWAANELIRFPHSINLPPDLPAGLAKVTLTFVDAEGAPLSEPFEMGTLSITVPERTFTIPTMAHAVNYDFGGVIRLLGYNLDGQSITFYWQALQPVSTRYIVFVHNFDAANTFTAGNDAPPTRPATSWLPGEVIADTHPLTITDHFEVGFYDPATGERLGEAYISK